MITPSQLSLSCNSLCMILITILSLVNARKSEVDESCSIETSMLGLKDYHDDPFWFENEVNNYSCMSEVNFADDLTSIFNMCDWSTDDANGRGETYEFVKQSCDEKGGRMHLVNYDTTSDHYVHSEDLANNPFIQIILENSLHRNLPVCLAPSCDAEEVLNEVMPCSQHIRFSGNNFDPPDTLDCEHKSIIRATYMDDSCHTSKTRFDELSGDDEAYCKLVEEDIGNTVLCDYFDFTDESGSQYNPYVCNDVEATFFKYSYSMTLLFAGDEDYYGFEDKFYFVNEPTCMKQGCDYLAYFEKVLIPDAVAFHACDLYIGEDGCYEVERSMLMGLLPVHNEIIPTSSPTRAPSPSPSKDKSTDGGGKSGKNGKSGKSRKNVG